MAGVQIPVTVNVPAPGRSTPAEESCERQVVGLLAGSAADIVTAKGRKAD